MGHRVAGTQSHASRGSKATLIPQTHTPSTELHGQWGSVPPRDSRPAGPLGNPCHLAPRAISCNLRLRQGSKAQPRSSEALSTTATPAQSRVGCRRRCRETPEISGEAWCAPDGSTNCQHSDTAAFHSGSRPHSGPSARCYPQRSHAALEDFPDNERLEKAGGGAKRSQAGDNGQKKKNQPNTQQPGARSTATDPQTCTHLLSAA